MNYKEIFISKQNLINLNNILLNKLNIKDISHNDKEKYIKILFDNMNISFTKLKLTSINENNIDYVKQQYNNIVVNTSIEDIKSNNLPNNNLPNNNLPNNNLPNNNLPNNNLPNNNLSNNNESNLGRFNIGSNNETI